MWEQEQFEFSEKSTNCSPFLRARRTETVKDIPQKTGKFCGPISEEQLSPIGPYLDENPGKRYILRDV